jgi:hypothetical protein
VADRPLMHVREAFNNILENFNCLLTVESAHAIHILEEGTTIQILKYKVYLFPLLEETVEFNEFRMIKAIVKFYFLNELIYKIVLLQLGFGYLFYCH